MEDNKRKKKEGAPKTRTKSMLRVLGPHGVGLGEGAPSGTSSNKQSTRGALEVDTLSGFVIVVIFIIVILTIIMKNKDFVQRLLP